jgi:predicted ATPase/signal transduction histidine kinase
MIELSGYIVGEIIHSNARSVVYRAVRGQDAVPVIIKRLNSVQPSLSELAGLRNEYDITHHGEIEGVVKTLEILHAPSCIGIVREDVGAMSLRQFIYSTVYPAPLAAPEPPALSMRMLIEIARSLTMVLGNVHRHSIIHKDLKPSNILIHPESLRVWLTDFSFASRLPGEMQRLVHPHLLQGTLAYMSPEQTGRTSALMDYRTDFYALGVTLYELLTGRLPFTAHDPLELIHAHLAQEPVAPRTLQPSVPEALSQVVLKLLAKNADVRYQSIKGLQSDLDYCLGILDTPLVSAPHLVGQHDRVERLRMPQKLYGREQALQHLQGLIQEIRGGTTKVAAVGGYSGVGKTRLISELYALLTPLRGNVVQGKFDLLQRNVPYSALIQALRSLLRQVLCEPEEQLQYWKERLQTAVETNGALMTEVLPELEVIIGAQPPVQTLPPLEAQYRFNYVFQSFLTALASAAHPLVLFLDDMQWSDDASIQLLERVVTTTPTGWMLIVLAYRNNEVQLTHPFMQMLAAIERNTPPDNHCVQHLHLEPLQEQDVQNIVTDMLNSTVEHVASLANLLFGKTQGNPFFTVELLKSLYHDHHLFYDSQVAQWQWDVQSIEQMDLSDSVTDLMNKQMQALEPTTQYVLARAACVGNTIALSTLLNIVNLPQSELEHHLEIILHKGFLSFANGSYSLLHWSLSQAQTQYLAELMQAGLDSIAVIQSEYGNAGRLILRFSHDRIQQAAYQLIAPEERTRLHYEVGRLLVRSLHIELSAAQTAHASLASIEVHGSDRETFFDIVNHLNIGNSFIQLGAERHEAAMLNIEASKRAHAANAYHQAVDYAEHAYALLHTDTFWQQNYRLAFELRLHTAECLFLSGHFDRALELCEELAAKSAALTDKANVVNLHITIALNRGQHLEALTMGSAMLQELGLNFPLDVGQAGVGLKLLQVKLRLRGKSIEELFAKPDIVDEKRRLCIKLIMNLTTATFNYSPSLSGLAFLVMLHTTLQYGNSSEGAYAYGVFTAIEGYTLGNYERAYQYAELAIRLAEKYHDKRIYGRCVYVKHELIYHWLYSVRDGVEDSVRTHRVFVTMGDITYANFAITQICNRYHYIGTPLPEVETIAQNYYRFVAQTKYTDLTPYSLVLIQYARNLQGKTLSNATFSDEQFSEAEYLKTVIEPSKYTNATMVFRLRKMQSLYYYRMAAEAEEYALVIQKTLFAFAATINAVEYYTYYALVAAALYGGALPKQQRAYKKLIAQHLKKLQGWAQRCPANFEPNALLVQGEQARIHGRHQEALELYVRAAASAEKYQFLQHEALAFELQGRLLATQANSLAEAALALQQALACYQRWGALGKVRHLQAEFQHLLRAQAPPPSFAALFGEYAAQSDGSVSSVSQTTISMGSSTTMTASASSGTVQGMYDGATRSTGQQSLQLLDLQSVMKASQAISSEIVLSSLLGTLMRIVAENAGAQRGALLLMQDNQAFVQATVELQTTAPPKTALNATSGMNFQTTVLQALPLLESSEVSHSIVQYVARTRAVVVLADAMQEQQFAADVYVQRVRPKSVLCMPILHQGKVQGVLYMENNAAVGVFTPNRMEVLSLLASQIAVSLDNALLYERLEQKVTERTRDLSAANAEIRRQMEVQDEQAREIEYANNQLQVKHEEVQYALAQLKAAQSQLVQSEKMAGLGQLTAGVAHEINNPINFITASLPMLRERIENLWSLVHLYEEMLKDVDAAEHQEALQTVLQRSVERIIQFKKRVEFSELHNDIQEFLGSMDEGANRITTIVKGLRNFSRLDENTFKDVDIHEGLDSTLTILRNEYSGRVEIIKEYSDVPFVECQAGQINQVFMNILNNALQAINGKGTVRIRTEHRAAEATLPERVTISIKDSGRGMDSTTKSRIFEPFFTTKEIGKGTGLGLSISYGIIQNHNGGIEVHSAPGEGAEFVVHIPVYRQKAPSSATKSA